MDPNDGKPNKTTRPPKRIVWTFPTGKPETETSEYITSDIQSKNLPNNEVQSAVLQEASTSSAATTETPDVKPHSVIASDKVPAKGNVDFKFIRPAIVQASINNLVLMPELVLRPSEEAILKLQEKTPKPKKRKFKTARAALVTKPTSDIALAHFPTDEQTAFHENSSSKSRNSKYNAIGPAIVQATLNHPFAWLKDFKARDEISQSLEKTRLDPTDSKLRINPTEAPTSADSKPGPSHINRNQYLQPPLKILVKSAEPNETNGTKINEPSSFTDIIESSASPKSETVINFIDPSQGGSLQNQSGENDEKNKPKKCKFKTVGPVVVAPSTSNTSLVNTPKNEHIGPSELYEIVSSKSISRKSRNSKFNTIGPAIVQGTLSHPFAWLKDYKPLDELLVPSTNQLEPANAKNETKHDLQPGPSRGNGNPSNQSVHKTVVKSEELNNPKNSTKLSKQTKAKLNQQQQAILQFANLNEFSLLPKSATTIINFTDPLHDGSVPNESEENTIVNIPEGSVNNTSDQTAIQDELEQHPVDHRSMISRIVHWNPNPEHPLVKCLENSGILGLNESVKQDLHICTRLYWILAFFFILSFCIIILMWGRGKLQEHPLKIELVATEFFTSDVPFPTTTSSLTKSYKKSELMKIEEAKDEAYLVGVVQFYGEEWSVHEIKGLMFNVDEVALSTTSFSSQLGESEFETSDFHYAVQAAATKENFTLFDNPNSFLFRHKIVPVMKKGMINCKELILQCSWNGEAIDCLKMIRSYFSSIGITCSFNLAPDSATKRNITVKSLFEEPVDDDERKKWETLNMDEYFESMFKKSVKFKNGTTTLPLTQKVAGYANGYTQLLYAKKGEYSYPQLDADGFMINLSPLFGDPNIARYGFAVPFNNEAFIAVTPEITLANPEIYKIAAIERGCYNSSEFHLDFYKHYSLENCLNEMLAKDVYKDCHCTPLSAPKLPNTVICDNHQKLCAARVEKRVFEKNPAIVYKQCLPSCSKIVYRYDISYLVYSQEDPPDYVKKRKLGNDTVTSLIHVFMKDRTVIGKVRDVKYEAFDKVGLLGGIFGFTSGIAIINIAYLVLAIVICVFSIRKWRQRSAAKKLAVTAGRGTSQSVNA